jgi:cell division protein FtsB
MSDRQFKDKVKQFDDTFREFKRSSIISTTLVLAGALFLIASIVYSAMRLRPLEREIDNKREEIAKLDAAYQILKTNVEQLYSVRVTPSNQVYELRATAKATGRNGPDGPQYNFTIFVNADQETLNSISYVEYHFNHPTFNKPVVRASDPQNRFATSYLGWGCLTSKSMSVTVFLKEGTLHTFPFDMCKSLGPSWSG